MWIFHILSTWRPSAKLAKEELDLPSMMASDIAASLPPARESYRAAAIIPNTHMQLSENLNSVIIS